VSRVQVPSLTPRKTAFDLRKTSWRRGTVRIIDVRFVALGNTDDLGGAVASVVKRVRKGGAHYQVKWRLGGAREGAWQSETSTDGRAAAKFKADVEAYDHAWPDGWVKGHGYLTAPFPVHIAGSVLVYLASATRSDGVV
jgi:hypothetical protein